MWSSVWHNIWTVEWRAGTGPELTLQPTGLFRSSHQNEWDWRYVLSRARIADKRMQNTVYEAFEQWWSGIDEKFRWFSWLVAPCDDFTEYLSTVNILLPGNDPKLWNQSHHCALCCAVHGRKLWGVLFRLKTKRELIQKCVTAAVRRLSRSFITTEPCAADFISGIVQIIYLQQWPFSKARKVERLHKYFNIKYYKQTFYDAWKRLLEIQIYILRYIDIDTWCGLWWEMTRTSLWGSPALKLAYCQILSILIFLKIILRFNNKDFLEPHCSQGDFQSAVTSIDCECAELVELEK